MADEEAQVPLEELAADLDVAPVEEEPKQATGKRKAVKAEPEVVVGQDVHYVWNGSHTQGEVVEVFDGKVITLKALNGGIQAVNVSFDESGAEGTWHYPEE